MGNRQTHMGGKAGDGPTRRVGAAGHVGGGRAPAAAAASSDAEGKDDAIDIYAKLGTGASGKKLSMEDFDALAVRPGASVVPALAATAWRATPPVHRCWARVPLPRSCWCG